MNVLWFSNETPDSGGQGGQRRQYWQIHSLVAAGHEVDLVTLAGPQDDASVSEVLGSTARVEVARGRLRRRMLRRGAAERLVARATADRAVVAHLESVQTLRALDALPRVPTLVDAHNVYSRQSSPDRLLRRWRARERWVAEWAEVVSVCSLREAEAFRRSTGREAMVVPHGLDVSTWTTPPRPAPRPVVKLFGNWGWGPNARGVEWFCRDVWPRVLERSPGVTALVAGAGVPERLPAGVRAVGRVPDVADFLSDAWVVSVPVVEGLGAPVKTAEAMATGVPLLLTEDASEQPTVGGALVTNDPCAWADFICQVAVDPAAHRVAAGRRRDTVLPERAWGRTSQPLVDWVSSGALARTLD